MSTFRNAIIQTPTKKDWDTVTELTTKAGYNKPPVRVSSGLVIGKWAEYNNSNDTLHTGEHFDKQHLLNYHPDWPVFIMPADLDKLKEYLGLIEWDESPLPNTMEKELAEATQKKFNLSPDQWEAIPYSAQLALAGAPVEIKVVGGGGHNWVRVEDGKPVDHATVLLCGVPGSLPDSIDSGALGYWTGSEWVTRPTGFPPRYWCYLPGYVPDSDDQEEETEEDHDDPYF